MPVGELLRILRRLKPADSPRIMLRA